MPERQHKSNWKKDTNMSFAIIKYWCSVQVCSISKHLVFFLDFTQ